MNQEGKNLLTAILACLAFYFLYMSYMQKKYPQPVKDPNSNGEVAQQDSNNAPGEGGPAEEGEGEWTKNATPPTAAALAVEKAENIKWLPKEELTIATDTNRYRFSQMGSAITSAELVGFRQDKNSDSGPMELLKSPLLIQAASTSKKGAVRDGFHAERSGRTIKFWRSEDGWYLEQKFSVPEKGNGMNIELTYRNDANQERELDARLLGTHNASVPPKSSFFQFVAERYSVVSGIAGSRDYEDVTELCEDDSEVGTPALEGKNEVIDYLGFDLHYFLALLQPPPTKFNYQMRRIPSTRGDGCPFEFVISQNQGLIKPGQAITLAFGGYFGPKEVDIMHQFDARLDSALDLGWFGVIAHPLLLAVKSVYKFVGNYGIAILIITAILKILFYPLTKASAVSMNKMKKLQPQMNALREKFKDDPQKQQQELMSFMGKHKINPAKGCLPILPQIPVFIAFWNVLSHAIELRHAPFAGWIQDLSASDPYFITPILLGIGMFLQQKINPNPGMDKNQERIMLMMPIIFTVMMLSLPAGMVLYMIANTGISIAQQHWLNRKLAQAT